MRDRATTIHDAYEAYNTRQLADLIALLSPSVDWPDDDGNRLHGHAAVTGYWSTQWSRVHVHDTPAVLADLSSEVTVVRVDQVARNLAGAELSRGTFAHVFHFDNGLISRLDIIPI